MKRIRRVFIGGIVIFLLFSIFLGLDFLIISIVCTAGITLIVYVPVAYFIGLGLEKLFFSLTGHGEEPVIFANNTTTSSTNNEMMFGSDDQALVKYIKEARATGMSDDTIKQNLYEHGWSSVQVEKILRILANYE